MELKDIRVFVVVPGVGKTTLSEMDNRFVDLDTIRSQYKYGISITDKSANEKTKGNRGKPVHNDADKYIEKLFLEYYYNTNKIMLFSPNPVMVNMIISHGIPYCLVYHSNDKETVEDIRQRMRNRGNSEDFINSMVSDEILKKFYKENVEDTRPALKIELFKGQYLSDKLLDIFKNN